MDKKYCVVCGNEIDRSNNRHARVTCSDECRKIHEEKLFRSRYEIQKDKWHKKTEKPKRTRSRKKSLADVALEARQAGMSYGKYVALHDIGL